jgi:predicted DNA binding CopG/RHH family protein
MTRKPMTFDIDRSPPTPAEVSSTKPPAKKRKQVGARIPETTYRQLKARAALEGVTVQSLVEQAVAAFLASAPGR